MYPRSTLASDVKRTSPPPAEDALPPGTPRELAQAPSPALAPPPGNPRFPLFDGMRGIAVLGILAFHVLELTGKIGLGIGGRLAEVAGYQAVIVFFVISGFLLYRPYVAARTRGRPVPSTRRYARRRALRILPGYWTVLTLLAIYPGVTGAFSGQWWRFYGYLQLYAQHTQNQGIPVAWTLCVEVTYYIALPFWAFGVRRLARGRGARALVISELAPIALVIAGGFIVQLAAAHRLVSHIVASSLAGQFSWIAIGMALAVASAVGQRERTGVRALDAAANHSTLCWCVAAAGFVGLAPLQPSQGLYGLIAAIGARQSLATTAGKLALETVVVVALVLPIIFGDQSRGAPRRIVALRPVAWLGVISYSFYLWHLTVAEWIAWPKATGSFSAGGLNLLGHVHVASSLVLYVVTFAATAALASTSYRFIELPFLRRKETS